MCIRDSVHLAAVDTARLPLSLLDEVAEERGAWRKRQMVDVAIQGLVHSEDEPGHSTSFPHAAHPRGSDCVMQSVVDRLISQVLDTRGQRAQNLLKPHR